MKLIYEDGNLSDYVYRLDDLSSIDKMASFLNRMFPNNVFSNLTIVFENDDEYIPSEEYNNFEEIVTKYKVTNLNGLVDHISLNTLIDDHRALITMYPNGAVLISIMKKKITEEANSIKSGKSLK